MPSQFDTIKVAMQTVNFKPFFPYSNIKTSSNSNMSDLEKLEERIALLEKQMFNVNRELELGLVSEFWEQSGQGSKLTPNPPSEESEE